MPYTLVWDVDVTLALPVLWPVVLWRLRTRGRAPAALTLDALLRARGITGGPCWLIDMLGLARLRLQHQRTNDAVPGYGRMCPGTYD